MFYALSSKKKGLKAPRKEKALSTSFFFGELRLKGVRE